MTSLTKIAYFCLVKKKDYILSCKQNLSPTLFKAKESSCKISKGIDIITKEQSILSIY